MFPSSLDPNLQFSISTVKPPSKEQKQEQAETEKKVPSKRIRRCKLESAQGDASSLYNSRATQESLGYNQRSFEYAKLKAVESFDEPLNVEEYAYIDTWMRAPDLSFELDRTIKIPNPLKWNLGH